MMRGHDDTFHALVEPGDDRAGPSSRLGYGVSTIRIVRVIEFRFGCQFGVSVRV